MSDTEKAYLAGIIDGEGYIGITNVPPSRDHNQRFRPRLEVYGISPDLATFLGEIGFSGLLRTKVKANERPIFRSYVSESVVGRVVGDVLPYLKVKKAQAALMIRFIEIRQAKRDQRPFRNKNGTFPARESYEREEMELIRKLFELKTNKGPKVREELYGTI